MTDLFVRDLMTFPVFTVGPVDSIAKVRDLMYRRAVRLSSWVSRNLLSDWRAETVHGVFSPGAIAALEGAASKAP